VTLSPGAVAGSHGCRSRFFIQRRQWAFDPGWPSPAGPEPSHEDLAFSKKFEASVCPARGIQGI